MAGWHPLVPGVRAGEPHETTWAADREAGWRVAMLNFGGFCHSDSKPTVPCIFDGEGRFSRAL